MKHYIACDGGGTKLQAILFNEEGTILSTGYAGGTNTNVRSAEEADANVADCMRQLFEGAPYPIDFIDAIVASQPSERYQRGLSKHAALGGWVSSGEGALGVFACGLDTAICGLSGTGSDIFYVRDGKEIEVYGGWGYLLADDGSGEWIGVQAARSWMRVLEGRDKPTVLHDLMDAKDSAKSRNDLIGLLYHRSAPPAYLASYCKVVNEAAKKGDETAISILKQAGDLLANEAIELMEKHHLGAEIPVCTTASVFRHCDVTRERFSERITEKYPGVTMYRPQFEPVLGGLICCLYKKGMSMEEIMRKSDDPTWAPFRVN